MNHPDKSELVAVLGLGSMGSALADALLSDGYQVLVWNRTTSKAKPLIQNGARKANSAVSAIQFAETIVVCLADYDAIAAVIKSDGATGALRGKRLIQLGGLTAEQARELSDWARANGIAYLEGSILGGPVEVRAAASNPVCSGPKEDFDACIELLSAFGSPLHVSETTGAAYEFDKVNYPLGYGILLAFIQGAALAQAGGFSLEAYANITNERMPLYVERLKNFGSALAEQNYDVTVANLNAWAAGCKMTEQLCQNLDVDGTLVAAFTRMIEMALDSGYEDEEILAVFKALVPADKETQH